MPPLGFESKDLQSRLRLLLQKPVATENTTILFCEINFNLIQEENYSKFKNIISLSRTPEIGQGLGRILSCGARKPEPELIWTYDYCGLRTTTLFHDILQLP